MDTLEKLEIYLGKTNIGGEVPTPKNTVDDMTGLIPADKYNRNATFLDMYCKSGRYLISIKERLMASEEFRSQFKPDEDIEKHILEHQLFGIAATEISADIIRKELYGSAKHIGNIRYIEGYKDKIKNNDFGQNPNGSTMTFEQYLDKEFGK